MKSVRPADAAYFCILTSSFLISQVSCDNSAIARPSPKRSRTSGPPAKPPARVESPVEGGLTDARLGRIVRLLTDHALVVVSGTKLAKELGITRGEVWRLVQQLRALGVEIAGHPATGYTLNSVPDLLLPDILGPLLRGTMFGRNVHHYFKIGSTNLAAMQAGSAGAAEGSLFVAEEQTSGRGRGGHGWYSARSQGIYLSAVLRPQLAPADALVLSLLAGLVVRAAVEQVCGVSADLRWPNDLLLDGKKFCGILTELTAEATGVRHLVIGIGINVNQERFPADLETMATSLRLATGRAWSRVELAAALLKSLHREYRTLLAEGAEARASILRRFEAGSGTARGCRVQVEENGGYRGVTEGLDAHGFLLVKTEGGVRTVLSGGVRPIG